MQCMIADQRFFFFSIKSVIGITSADQIIALNQCDFLDFDDWLR